MSSFSADVCGFVLGNYMKRNWRIRPAAVEGEQRGSVDVGQPLIDRIAVVDSHQICASRFPRLGRSHEMKRLPQVGQGLTHAQASVNLGSIDRDIAAVVRKYRQLGRGRRRGEEAGEGPLLDSHAGVFRSSLVVRLARSDNTDIGFGGGAEVDQEIIERATARLCPQGTRQAASGHQKERPQ